jgi:hypothetical protein
MLGYLVAQPIQNNHVIVTRDIIPILYYSIGMRLTNIRNSVCYLHFYILILLIDGESSCLNRIDHNIVIIILILSVHYK